MGENILNFEDKKQEIEQKRAKIDDHASAVLNYYQQEEGMDVGEAYAATQAYMDGLQTYFNVMDGVDPEGGINPYTGMDSQVQRSAPLEAVQKEIKNWDFLTNKDRAEKLWEYGYNTKDYPFGVNKLFQYLDGKRIIHEVVWGLERLDKEWTSKRDENYEHLASFEARTIADRARYGGISLRSLVVDKEVVSKGELKGGYQVK